MKGAGFTRLAGVFCLAVIGASSCSEEESATPGASTDTATDTAQVVADVAIPSDTLADDTLADDTHADDTLADDTHADDTLADDTHADDTHADDTHADDTHDSDVHVGPVHWTYDGEDGPTHWGDLSPDYATCNTGTEQSPVDIPAVSPASHPAMAFNYTPSQLTVLNNGHTVQANYAPGSTLTVEGHAWELLQFHFHAHSEHTVGGVAAPVELHFVHKDTAGALAVVGVMIEPGDHNTALAAFVDNMPATETKAADVAGVNIDAAALLPSVHASWRYEGSLTTPPCSEGVSWFVLSEGIEASPEQIAAFEAIHNGNYRPAQPLNDRVIEAPHWTYEGDEGPTHWGELSPDFELCASGTEQSPIDIPSETVADVPSVFTLSYTPAPLAILNNGHTVQVNWAPGSTLTLASGEYELLQFHVHTHSEHLVDGASAPLEIHFVHKNTAGELAVVGVLVDEGIENTELSKFVANMPATKTPVATVDGVSIDAMGLIPATTTSWRYSGSLTTPPCSEGVTWTVLSTHITASKEQIGAIGAVVHENFRPAQPLGNRTIN